MHLIAIDDFSFITPQRFLKGISAARVWGSFIGTKGIRVARVWRSFIGTKGIRVDGALNPARSVWKTNVDNDR